jgi:hypothetical protein
MSNGLAIAAVTMTLQNMLFNGVTADLPADVNPALNLGNTKVTTKPVDKARGPNDNFNQLNLCLYQTTPNGALRNMPMPAQVKPGETGNAPAALTLHYLVTAIGQDDDDVRAHILLGQAIRILHDNAVLSPASIKNALAGNDLHEQIERVRITALPLSLEEMSKLWTTFQTQYRISAAYQVSVVLIESKRPSKTPLPVLTRGKDDTGIASQSSPIPPFPTLEEVSPPNQQPAAHLGDVLILHGHHLDGDSVKLRFTHPRLLNAIELAPQPGASPTSLSVKIPDVGDDPQAPAEWPAGFYHVAAVITTGSAVHMSNELTFALAPRIEQLSPSTASPGDFILTVTCMPQIRPEQRFMLLFGNREIPVQTLSAPAAPSDPSTAVFAVDGAAEGDYFVRLRVDGVDSILVAYAGVPPMPVFDPDQKVTVTP